MKCLLLALILACAAASSQAQFNFDLNRLKDTVRNVRDAFSDVGEKEEIEIGREVAAVLLGAAPLTPDEGLQRYVNRLGRWLATQTERPDLPWRFAVLEAPQVNAFATPGGYVFVTRGLLNQMRSESELAGVLSHEMIHVLQKHHLKAIQKGARANLFAEGLSAGIKKWSPETRAKLAAFTKEMYTRGLDKGDEFEADRLGVVIAARGGYDPYGLIVVLQALQARNAQDSDLALMFKTHPSPTERLEVLEKGNLAFLDAYGSQPQVADRFLATLKNVNR